MAKCLNYGVPAWINLSGEQAPWYCPELKICHVILMSLSGQLLTIDLKLKISHIVKYINQILKNEIDNYITDLELQLET